MRRTTRLPIAVSAALAVGAFAAALVFASADSPDPLAKKGAGGFTPAKIKGKWTGGWTNTTFGSTGKIRANVQAKRGNKLVVIADFGGFVFGCEDPPAAIVTLTKGSGPNKWNSKGFKIKQKTEAFGMLNLTYVFKTKVFKGNGLNPPCRPELTFTLNGKLTGAKFRATVVNDLGGGSTATSKLTAAKR